MGRNRTTSTRKVNGNKGIINRTIYLVLSALLLPQMKVFLVPLFY